LLAPADARTAQAMHDEDPRYWYWRCRALEIEWVAIEHPLPAVGHHDDATDARLLIWYL
jgi:hypothetical protein